MLPSQVSRPAAWRAPLPTRHSAFKRDLISPRLVWIAVAAVIVVTAVFVWSRFTAPGGGAPVTDDLATQRAAIPPGGPAPAAQPGPGATPSILMGAPLGAAPSAADRPAVVTSPGLARQPGDGRPTTTTPPAADQPPALTGDSFKDVRDLIDAANRAQTNGKPVEARTLLNRALMTASLPASERAALRNQIQALQESLIFGRLVGAGDPFTDTYTVQQGDSLVKIMQRQSLPPDWRLLQRINKLARPGDLHAGDKLKIVRIPFHAVVHKNDYRMDIYIGDPIAPGASNGTHVGPDGQEESWTFVRSFRVGLGESNGTPEGTFVVRPRSKLLNPRWVNPRNGQKFDADDPKNPIGEHWIGLDGADEHTRKFAGYGIHGTIEPDSIGQSRSMGCVRMLPDDVAIVFELLSERLSSVKILP